MFQILTRNEISDIIFDAMAEEKYAVSKDASQPDAVLVRSASMLEDELPDTLQAIARAGAGYNNVPVDKCSKKGIVVFNTPGANANGVKELILLGMLLGSRRVAEAMQWVKTLKGKGDAVPGLVEKGKSQFVGPELRGKTLGVVGLGAIGGMVANAAYSLKMKVIGYDPFLSVDAAWRLSRAVKRSPSMEELLAQSDFITVHVPLSAENKQMVNAEFLSHVKKGAVLLNFSRAEVVDGEAVRNAIQDGTLRTYVVDFPTDDMIDVEGVLAIPHLGASTPESEENCARMASEQVANYLETGSIKNSVNFPDIDLPPVTCVRLAILHLNVPNMIGATTSAVAKAGINIAHMVNKSRNDLAYTVLDLDHSPAEDLIKSLEAMEGVLRVRVIQ